MAPDGLGGERDRRLVALVRGRVQGVGYRMFVVDAATGLGLVGWVSNEPGGTVRAVVEGPEGRLLELLRELRSGPAGARVDAVEETWSPPTGAFDRFTVRSGWHSGD